MREMAEAMGLWVVEGVPLTGRARLVDDCSVLLLPAGATDDEVDGAIAWAVEQVTAALPAR